MEDKKIIDIPITKDNFNPIAAPLSNAHVSFASKELIRKYEKVLRYKSDPVIPRQEVCNISFMLLKEPQNGVYGFFKPRGCWEDNDRATIYSENIIRNVDSVFPIHHAHVGYWNPITNNEAFSQDQMDVKVKEEDIALRDRAAKESSEKNMQQRRELEELKEEIKNTTSHDDENSIDYYTKKKISQKEMTSHIIQAKEKIRLFKKNLRKVDSEILELNRKHPKYCDMWLANYNEARAKVGLPPITENQLLNVPTLGSLTE